MHKGWKVNQLQTLNKLELQSSSPSTQHQDFITLFTFT